VIWWRLGKCVKVALLSLTASVAFGLTSSAAFACQENGTLVWAADSHAFNKTGNRQDIVQRFHSNPNCGNNSLQAGDTAHQSVNGGTYLIETGYRDYKDAGGTHYFRYFTEDTVPGGHGVHEFGVPSLCPTANGAQILFDVQTTSVGGTSWRDQVFCGGTWIQLGADLSTSFSAGSALVETFRFCANSTPCGFIAATHNSLQYRSTSGSWSSSFAHMTCIIPMAQTKGVPNSSTAATSWTTQSQTGSGC
jgi:hypothetical protein